MTRLRLALFGALCLAQLAIPLSMAYRYERTRREGTLYRFRTEPFDPVDAFRGRYVAIRLRLVGPETLEGRWSEQVYVTLEEGSDGLATARSISIEKPAGGDWLLGTMGEVLYEELPGRNPPEGPPPPPRRLGTRIELPLDRYYMEESKAPEADRLWADGMRQAEATARVRVRHGLGAIEGIDVNGVPIERWIATLPPPE